ncbi:MAG: hypothetical protein OXC40_00325 [Proteobacteria bacterium]|nr:hypothetical protein [Pseudomonadota bacterium]
MVRLSFGGGKVGTPEDIEGNVPDQLASIERNEKLSLSLYTLKNQQLEGVVT